MEWVVAIGLLAAGLIGAALLYLGKRDRSTARYIPGVFRHPGSFFEPNRQHDDKGASDKNASDKRSGSR